MSVTAPEKDWTTALEYGAETRDQSMIRSQGVHRPHAASSSRFTPYPSPVPHVNAGPSTKAMSSGRSKGTSSSIRLATLTGGPPPKSHPVKRVSWFPTPDTLSAPRKGNMGHWTGKMEFAYRKRIEELVHGNGIPKTASDWASLNFGTKAKHLMRASNAAASAVINKSTSLSSTGENLIDF